MMQFYGALILLMTLPAAYGLKCYACSGKNCASSVTCPPLLDRCVTQDINGVITKSCMNSAACGSSNNKCCGTSYCNSAVPTGSSAFLLLASSVIITVFL